MERSTRPPRKHIKLSKAKSRCSTTQQNKPNARHSRASEDTYTIASTTNSSHDVQDTTNATAIPSGSSKVLDNHHSTSQASNSNQNAEHTKSSMRSDTYPTNRDDSPSYLSTCFAAIDQIFGVFITAAANLATSPRLDTIVFCTMGLVAFLYTMGLISSYCAVGNNILDFVVGITHSIS